MMGQFVGRHLPAVRRPVAAVRAVRGVRACPWPVRAYPLGGFGNFAARNVTNWCQNRPVHGAEINKPGCQEEPRWEQRYAELPAYRQQFGHSNVPSHWPQNNWDFGS